jgi:predicted permease
MTGFFFDARQALRRLTTSPVYAVVAIFTLALGIGLNTAMFSVLNVLILRPVPYPRSDRLVRIFGVTPEARNWALTGGTFADLRRADLPFESLAMFAWWGATLTEPGQPAEILLALRVSSGFLPTLGVQPEMGRWFTAEEDQPDNGVVVISHEFWQRHFAGDPGVIGRRLLVDRQPTVVIGVMPATIAAPNVFGVIDLWKPMGLTAAQWENRDEKWLQVIARVRDGVSMKQASVSLEAVAARIAHDFPRENELMSLQIVPLHASGTTETERRTTWFTLGLAGFVLLIACANLANLQLARASRRTHEFAVRSALGATRMRLLRPMVLESLLIGLFGGGAGLLITLVCNEWIGRRMVFAYAPTGHELPLDGRVMVFAAIASILTGLICGTLPAWFGSRTDLNSALKAQGRGNAGRTPKRLGPTLVVTQLAIALVLLVGSTLLLGGISDFLHRSSGWQTERVAYGYVATQTPQYHDLDKACDFYERICERLSRLPGVEAVAFGWDLPIVAGHPPRPIRRDGQPAGSTREAPLAFFTGVLPGYFDALGIHRRDGRDFTRRDRSGTPRVAIINETMARILWPGQSAVGQRISYADSPGSEANPAWMEIIGVVGDARFAGNMGASTTQFQVYVPFRQEPWNWGAVALRTSVAPDALLEPMRRAIAEIDPDIPVWQASTVAHEIDRRVANANLSSELLGAIALLGLLLAALGIYAVIAQLVTQRTPEIGVRIALGADAQSVYRLVLGAGLRMAVVGTALGLLGAWGASRVLRSISPELRTTDPWMIVGLSAILMAVAFVACWLPARKAVRIDPVLALRGD